MKQQVVQVQIDHETTNSNKNNDDEADIEAAESSRPVEAEAQEEEGETSSENDNTECMLLEEPTPGADRMTRWLTQRQPPLLDHQEDCIVAVEEFMGVDVQLRDQLRHDRRHSRGSHYYDTRQYTTPDSPLWHHTANRMDLHHQQIKVTAIGSLLQIVIAWCMSIIGFAIAQCTEHLLQWKIDIATNYLLQQSNNNQGKEEPLLAFWFWIIINLLLGLLATLPVLLWKPISAGSGIAEAKAVLNGIQLEGCTELSTAFCKAISVICAGAASLPVGLEGPMIFIGLALGDNVVDIMLAKLPKLLGGMRRLGQQRQWPTLQAARQVYGLDKNKRDLQAIGTASGVTSAFSSPIGGVLFAMEEGCSYWSYDLAWRCFTAACVTAIFTYLWDFLLAFVYGEQDTTGGFLPDGIVSKFEAVPSNSDVVASTTWISFRMMDYLVFAAMGIMGGILGACWCEANRYLAITRAKWHHAADGASKASKCLEVLSLVVISSTILWCLPQIYIVCSEGEASTISDPYYHTIGCEDGEYNHLATLFWNPMSSAGINHLFWDSSDAFSGGACVVAGTVILVLLLLLFGSSIGMGIFIPLLFVGACYGRTLGTSLGPELVTTYAMVGSVATLAGVTRVFISLCVIIITATGQPHLITPFMVATIFARASGKAIFGREGIYDIILELKQIPFLGEHPARSIMYRGLKAKDIMSPILATLKPEETVHNILECLKKGDDCQHDIPIIDPKREDIMLGSVSRSQLVTILTHNELFYDDSSGCGNTGKALTFETLQNHPNNNLPSVETMQRNLSQHDLDLTTDLTTYMRISPDTLDLLASSERAYNLFRTMGMRSLFITDAMGRPAGIITRNDLYRLVELEADDRKTGDDEEKAQQTSTRQASADDFLSCHRHSSTRFMRTIEPKEVEYCYAIDLALVMQLQEEIGPSLMRLDCRGNPIIVQRLKKFRRISKAILAPASL